MPPAYRFGPFELDPDRRELRRQGVCVRIQPRPLDILLHLARHHDRVVTRAELLETLWSGVQVNDEALGFAIHQARRAVDDDGTRQAVIRTVSRNGFRFVAPLESEATPHAGAKSAFVGRSEVLAAADAALRAGLGGTRGLLMLGGEAGIGKTRTAEVVAEAARVQGFQVFVARCVEVEGAPVFWPWIQLLRPMLAAVPAEELEATLGAGAPELARLLPEIRQRLPDLPDPTPADAKAARFLLFDSVAALVKRKADQRPLLLVIDDLHRSDVSSLILLVDLMRQLAASRVVLLCTHREAEMSHDKARSERLAELVREEGTRLATLRGLSEEEIGDFVEATTGRIASAAIRADLRERTNGNPFFLHQIVQALRSENRTHEVESRKRLHIELPRHSQDAIARQVSGLPREVVAFLEIAAVVGRDFEMRLMERITGKQRQEIVAQLEMAIEARIVYESSSVGSRYGFAHVLLRDALYQRIDALRRSDLHLAVGRALLALEREGRPVDPPVVAYHFFQSARAGDVSEALEIALRAGRWAEERLAFHEAVTSFGQALELFDRIESPDQRRRCEILLALGDAYTKAGNRDAARQCFKSVALVAKVEGMPEELAAAALRFAPDFLAIETGVYDSDLVSLLEDALANLPTTDGVIRARLLARLAVALHWAPGSDARREALCAEALEMATRMGDPATLRYVRCARELALYSIENLDRPLPSEPAGRLDSRDAPVLLLEQLLRMTSLLQSGQLEAYTHGIEKFASLARQLRQPQALWYVELFRATLANLEGRFADADMHARRFNEEGERVNDRNVVLSYYLHHFMRAIDAGGIQQLESPLRSIGTQFPNLPGWGAALALFNAEVGRTQDAVDEIDRMLDRGLATLPKRNEWMGMLLGVGIAAAEVRHTKGLLAVQRLASFHRDQLVTIGYSSFCWGPMTCLLGVTAAALEQWQLSQDCFGSAVSLSRRLGARPVLARSRFYEGRMLLSCGAAEQGIAALSEAAALATDLGLTRLAMKATSLGGAA